jgi:cytochrome c peroxidase
MASTMLLAKHQLIMKLENRRSRQPLHMGLLISATGLLLTLGLASCSGSSSQAAPGAAATTSTPPLSAIAQLGKKIFFDQSLSASGKMACSTCHDPGQHYGPTNDLAVQLGGPALDQAGARVAPQIAYDLRNPVFSIGPDISTQENVNVSQVAASASGSTIPQKTAGGTASATAMVPQGGLFWDGRANTLQEQIPGPFFNPVEMANASVSDLAAKLTKASYSGEFLAIFGAGVFGNPQLLVSEAENAVARFEFKDPSFHAYNSKYDYYLAGNTQLTASEMNGLKLFEDPNKGNCAGCHPDQKTADGQPPMFTDFQYEALGVPRNNAVPANAKADYYDLGLCGPTRTDLSAQTNYCGLFRTPSLRNVATRKTFFHNGIYKSLADVLQFYMFRDINPERFYSEAADGSVIKFNDLPAQYRANVDVTDTPFNRHPGDSPALNDSERQDLTAFLNTLTDGYQPANAYQ